MNPSPTFDREKQDIMRKMWLKPTGAFLAGGAITSTFTNQRIADFDLYFKSKEALTDAVLSAYDDGLRCVSASGRAITFSQQDTIYQLMHFGFFESPQQIFDSFDFTCCMAALDMDSGHFTFHQHFLSDTSNRDLVFNHRTAYPLASAMRVLKYQEKGYAIRKVEMLKIIAACNMQPVSGWSDLAEQIGGRYGAAVTLNPEADFDLDNVIAAISALAESKATDGPRDADEALTAIFGSADEVAA